MKEQSPGGARPAPKRSRHRTVARQGHVLDFDRYIPTIVSRLMTKLRNSAQVFFDEKYGITRLEWRILSFLAAEGPSSAYDIWTLGSLDKAAVSRAVKSLEARGLVAISAVPKSSRRRKAIALTVAGRKLNDATFQEIVLRHQRLLAGLSERDIEKFIATVKHLEQRIPAMSRDDDTALSSFEATKLPSRAPAARKRTE